MTYLRRIIETDALADVGPTSAGSAIFDLNQASRFSVQAVYDVQAPSAKTFDSGTKATLVNQSVTYTAVDQGVDGNDITITLIDPGTNGVLSISVVGTAISVTLAYAAAAVTTTASLLVTALLLDAGVTALVTPSGAGASPLAALATTPLTGGVDSEVNVPDSEFTIPAHGFPEGFKLQATTTGTLPAPLQLATDYFVIVVDADTIQLATSLANALAGTEITLVDDGSNGAVNTLTGVALAGASVTFQKRNHTNAQWIDIQVATAVTVDGSVMIENTAVAYRYLKVVKALTSGVVDMQAYVLVTGE